MDTQEVANIHAWHQEKSQPCIIFALYLFKCNHLLQRSSQQIRLPNIKLDCYGKLEAYRHRARWTTLPRLDFLLLQNTRNNNADELTQTCPK